MNRLTPWLITFSVLSVCCGGDSPSGPSLTRIPVKSADYFGLTWTTDGWIWVGHRSPDADSPAWVLRVRPDGTGLIEVPLPDGDGCSFTEYFFPELLPDGRVQVAQFCHDVSTPGYWSLLAYDQRSGELSALPAPNLPFRPVQVAWNPSLSRALISDSQGICASLAWMTAAGILNTPINVAAGTRSFRVDQGFHEDPSASCDGEGRADWPAWSLDGEKIAFFASPQSIGVAGFDRLDAPWNLYLMGPNDPKPERVISDVTRPRDPAWSPDSRWLAFGGDVQGNGKGLWLFSRGDQSLVRVSPREIDWVAWSPDGRRIAAITKSTGPPEAPKSDLVVFDVSSLLANSG